MVNGRIAITITAEANLLPTGAQPTVDIEKTGNNEFNFIFGIPKGDTGATGPQGIQGPTGATGPQGPQGPSGVYTGPLKPTTDYWKTIPISISNYYLPAGGTWAYFNVYEDVKQGLMGATGVKAGGSYMNANMKYGFCWRVS